MKTEIYTLTWKCGLEEMLNALNEVFKSKDVSTTILENISVTYNEQSFEYTGSITTSTILGVD